MRKEIKPLPKWETINHKLTHLKGGAIFWSDKE